MNKDISSRDYRAAAQEESARQRGKSLGHYARRVGKELAGPPRRTKVTPSKRG